MEKKVLVVENEFHRIDKRNHFSLDDYTHIRGYHGCRPLDVDQYYQRGIIPIKKEFAQQEALLRLCNEQITPDMIISMFEKKWRELKFPHKSVWFTFTEEMLIKFCGHYIIYGSEFINGIAAELWCQRNLKKVGKPTVFLCDIPISEIPGDYLKDINEYVRKGYNLDGFRTKGRTLPSCIKSHYHPSQIPDPLNHYAIYSYNE